MRITSHDLTWLGRDRLFDVDARLIVLPEPSGPWHVGTARRLVFDASRPGDANDGRPLLLRLWSPAAPSERQPAPYFLDPRKAELNLRAAPLPLPPISSNAHTASRASTYPLRLPSRARCCSCRRAAARPSTRTAPWRKTGWLYPSVLEVYSDLTREGYQLGAIAPTRAHAILTTYLRAFFDQALDDTASPLIDRPSAEYPEVVFHPTTEEKPVEPRGR